jgi:hypothetical protein
VVYVILDTGAQTSIGNPALRRMLTTGDPVADHFFDTKVISVTGQTTPAEFQTVPEVTIGGLTVKNMPLAFAQLHTFDVFGMSNQPAMLPEIGLLTNSGCCPSCTSYRANPLFPRSFNGLCSGV